MLTVPEAARRTGRDPETIRRWIRSGKLAAQRIGTQHLIDEADLDALIGAGTLPVPARWRTFDSGRRQPDWTTAIAASRRGR